MSGHINLYRKLIDLLEKEKLERRGYQLWIINSIIKAKRDGKNVIVELDAGMGKRVISYLISRIFADEGVLIITPSRASVWDMYIYFKKTSGSNDWFGTIMGGVSKRIKTWSLKNRRVIISTPISLARILEKYPDLAEGFNTIIINEVDKVLRRAPRYEQIYKNQKPNIGSATERDSSSMLVYPWNILKRRLPKDSCWIGMSGTLRDEHYVFSRDGIEIKKELETLANVLFPKSALVIITMDKLIERTDARDYILRNLTIISPIPVFDSKVKILVDCISMEMDQVIDRIKELYGRIFPDEITPLRTREKIQRTIAVLSSNNPLKIKFLRLALARRHILANTPDVYRKFLSKPLFRKIVERYAGLNINEIIPDKSSKIQKIIEIVKKWAELGQNIIIITSFVKTAIRMWRKLKEKSIANIYMLTGKTYNKRAILEKFRKNRPSVLILTPVAERDLDFPEASIVIIHDIISTVKSMYQRIKRARRSNVLILYYSDTFEERKVSILISRMIKRYPWSIRIRGS